MDKVLNEEVVVSAGDAELIGQMLEERRRVIGLEAAAAEELRERMVAARVVDEAELPGDRAAIGSTVSYEEPAAGTRRAVTLAVPENANPAAGLISVLSPVGSALVGRRAGDRVEAQLPDGRSLELRIASIAR